MKLIIGLGNPGNEYENTRHNIGFHILDSLAKKLDISFSKSKFNGDIYIDKDFILAKPHSYMNLSGKFAKEVANYYKINHNDILVVYDDLDLNIGEVKVKIKGSSNGQKGIQNIIDNFETNEIKRIKIGIGRPRNKQIPISTYVLSNFNKEEITKINNITPLICDSLITFIYNDIKVMLNKVAENNKKK